MKALRNRAVFGLLFACSLARAGDPPQPEVELPEVVVRVPAAPPAPVDPTASLTVVDAERIAGEAKDLGALVATVPGVAVQDQGGLGSIATVSIRGSTSGQVKVFLDGLPLDTAAGGGVDLSTIPPQLVSQVEVVRGVAGARFGSGALGGAVNLVTAPARAGEWSASATAGSFGTWRGSAQGTAGGERWAILGAAAASGSDGRFAYRFDPTPSGVPGDEVTRMRTHAAASVAGGMVKGWALLGTSRVDALVQLSDERRDLPGWPYDPTPNDWQSESRALAAARWRVLAGEGLVLSAGGFTRADRLDAQLSYLGGAIVRQRGLAGGADAGLRFTGGAGAIAAKAEVSAESLRADGIGDRSRAAVAGTLEAEVPLAGGRARIVPAVRGERAGAFDALSAELGATVALAGPLSVRARAGRSVRLPSFTELYLQQGLVEPNPSLRPEVGVGGDGALVAEGWAGRASAGAFATLYSDVIVYQAASFRRLQPMNDERAVARGAEAEVATAPIPRLLGLSTSLAYTLLLAETLRGSDAVLGKDLPRSPRHRLFGRIEVGDPKAEAHAEAQWTSRQWLDLQNTVPVLPALTVGLGGSLRIVRSPAVRVHLDVRNLLDDRSLQDGFGNPLPGRMVLVTLRAGAPENQGER